MDSTPLLTFCGGIGSGPGIICGDVQNAPTHEGSRESCCQRVTWFKWTNQSWGWKQLLDPCVTAVGADLLTSTSGKLTTLTLIQMFRSSRVFRLFKHTHVQWNLLGFMELWVLLRFRTFPVEERVICGVTSGQQSMKWSAFSNNSTERRQNGVKIGTRDRYATRLR